MQETASSGRRPVAASVRSSAELEKASPAWPSPALRHVPDPALRPGPEGHSLNPGGPRT